MRQLEERVLLEAFRVLDKETRATVVRFVQAEAARSSQGRRLTLVVGGTPGNDSFFGAVRKTKN